MDLFLIRHLPTESTKKGAYYGATDLGLSADSLKYKTAIKMQFGSQYVFYSSPMKRCLKSAELFFPLEEMIPQELAREVDFGEWEGMTFEEISKRNPELVDDWATNPDFSFPGGESMKHFADRVKNLAQQLQTHDKVVLVAHGGVIRYLICYFLGLDFNKSLLFHVELSSLTHLQVFDEDKGVLKGLGIREWQTYFL